MSNHRKYEQSHSWKEHLLLMEELELNSPDDRVQLIAALTATDEIAEHPEFACLWRFLLHFGFITTSGDVLPAWEQYWNSIGRIAWESGHREEWIRMSEAIFPQDIGPQI